MTSRGVETAIARLTLALLLIYLPIETWTSLPYGLSNPFYLADVIAMVLMAWGALRSLKAVPNSAPEILCVSYAWSSANGWRATASRLDKLANDGPLDWGMTEMIGITIATGVSLTLFIILLVLVIKR